MRIENADSIPPEFEVQIQAGKRTEIRIGKDRAPMVLIPAGEFQMGTDRSEIQQLAQKGVRGNGTDSRHNFVGAGSLYPIRINLRE